MQTSFWKPHLTVMLSFASSHVPLHGERMDNLFSTHPSTENRIAALQEMARAMGGASPAARREAPAPTAANEAPAGPWGKPADPAPEVEPPPPKPNPWGRNPTGPRNAGRRGPWS